MVELGRHLTSLPIAQRFHTRFLYISLHFGEPDHTRYAHCKQLHHNADKSGYFDLHHGFTSFLKWCCKAKAFVYGKLVHAQLLLSGNENDNYLIAEMYVKCNALTDACRLYETINGQNVHHWSIMEHYVHQGHGKEAFLDGEILNRSTIVSICTGTEGLEEGRKLHFWIKEIGFESDLLVATALINMYGKCRSIEDAKEVFGNMAYRDIVAWNSMIGVYVQNWHSREAFQAFYVMQSEGLIPDKVTFMNALDAAVIMANLAWGKQVHSRILLNGSIVDVMVETTLVHMYGNCRSMESARMVFLYMLHRNVISWNSMLTACIQNYCDREALNLFAQFYAQGLEPEKVTYLTILNACANLKIFAAGKWLHAHILRSGLARKVILANALIDMYGKSKSLVDAENVLEKMAERNVISWTSLIKSFALTRNSKNCLELFRSMQLDGVIPDYVTFISLLDACATLGEHATSKWVHSQIVCNRMEVNVVVGTALVNMYGKCGNVKSARLVFDSMPKRNLISWNAMTAVCAQCGHGKMALELVEQMHIMDVIPDKVTFISALDACASVAALGVGKKLHEDMLRYHIHLDIVVGNALVNMFGRCGNLLDARHIFERMPEWDVFSWNIIIAAYGQNGDGKEALQLFNRMYSAAIMPDRITFVNILSACSHGCELDYSFHQFFFISREHTVTPIMEHYGCMIDLLGRARKLDQAEDFVSSMPIQPLISSWMSLLGSSHTYVDIKVGKVAAAHVIELDPAYGPAYILLSNIYALAGQWTDAVNVNKMMLEANAKKEVGQSSIEVDNQVHEFVIGDKSHPKMLEIHAELQRLQKQKPIKLEKAYGIEEEEREDLLYYHSEKIALALGLISTPFGSTLRIIKNIPVCADCHTFTKFVSKTSKRHIIVRDANQVHHFKEGICSCNEHYPSCDHMRYGKLSF